MLGVDGDAVFPGGAAAEDSVEAGAGFDGQLEGLDEDGVGDAGREIDERLVGHGGGVAEVLQGFGAGVGLFALEGFGAFDEGHLDRDLDFQDVDVVAGLAELGHGAGDDVGFAFGVGEALSSPPSAAYPTNSRKKGMSWAMHSSPMRSIQACLRSLTADFSKGL